MCGWINVGGDDFDWIPFQGATSSTATGPSGDHTSGSGAYRNDRRVFVGCLGKYFWSSNWKLRTNLIMYKHKEDTTFEKLRFFSFPSFCDHNENYFVMTLIKFPGFYMLIETSSPRVPGEKAELSSEIFLMRSSQPDNNHCLSFL